MSRTVSGSFFPVESIQTRQFVTNRNSRRVRRASVADLLPVVVLFFVLVAQLSVRIVIIEKSYSLEQLRFSALERDSELRQLKLELAYATRPMVIASKAKEDLNFIPLSVQKTRMVKSDVK